MNGRDWHSMLCVVSVSYVRESVSTSSAFVASFFQRHPSLKKYTVKVVDKSGSGEASHPEARQHGDEVWLFPKFWQLPSEVQDFVFTHELGHWVHGEHGLAAVIEALSAAGIDAWDTDTLPFGQPNMMEAFADVFAAYFLDKAELLRRYPAWAKVLSQFL